MALSLAIRPLSKAPDCVVTVPGSKSHTNRALVCAALASGTSELSGVLFADDTKAMLGALTELGIQLEIDEAGCAVRVRGSAGRLQPTGKTIQCGQSGTTSRFLLPMLSLASLARTGGVSPWLDGHAQLRDRPFRDLVTALSALGVELEGKSQPDPKPSGLGRQPDRLPMRVSGGALAGGVVAMEGNVSSQFLSGLMLSAPYATEEMTIAVGGELVSKPYVDLTLATMASFGLTVSNDSYQQFRVPASGYQANDVTIEPDATAASYFFAAAAISGGRVTVHGLGTDTVQGDLAFVEVLAAMGAQVTMTHSSVTVAGPRDQNLSGVTVDMADISDTVQTLAAIAPFADGPTTVTGVGFIRHKETDRLKAVCTELSRLGIRAIEHDDGLTISPGQPSAGLVDTYDDHRMAMSFSLIGLRREGISIANPGCVAKTFPSFFGELQRLETSE